MPTKPTPTVRAARSKKASPPQLEGRALQRELDKIGRKHERPDEEPAMQRGVVLQPGRPTKAGRKGGRYVRRTMLYLPLEVHEELEALAKKRGLSVSNAGAEILADALGVTLEATG